MYQDTGVSTSVADRNLITTDLCFTYCTVLDQNQMMQKVGHEGHRLFQQGRLLGLLQDLVLKLFIQFLRVYLLSISLNGLHSKLTEQKQSVQNSILPQTRITSITSIRLFSAGSIAMRKIKCFLSVDSIFTIRIYETFNTGHAKIV